jgi:hypothetical protein
MCLLVGLNVNYSCLLRPAVGELILAAVPPSAAAAGAGRSRNRELQELFQSGLGLHHAGMLRSDRNLTERLFSEGWIKVGGMCLCVCMGEGGGGAAWQCLHSIISPKLLLPAF